MPNTLPENIGILLINLGTPTAPTEEAVRPYLREFLSDPRVVDLPPWLWKPILHLIVLRRRPRKSAHKYQSIWMQEGSPLRVYTERQTKLLRGRFVQADIPNVVVDYAMRYGEPSVATALARLTAQRCTRLLFFPLYPQYATSSTESALDAVNKALKEVDTVQEWHFIRSFCTNPGYISALAKSVQKHWEQHGQGEKLVISFHGVPRATIDKGDPYYDECLKTAKLLTEALQLSHDRFEVTFQSRFGRAKWIEPYTQATLEKLAQEGTSHVDVICPGFVSDCLETLEEIAIECKAAFIGAGGKQFHYIPALNDSHAFSEVLFDLCCKQLTIKALPELNDEQDIC